MKPATEQQKAQTFFMKPQANMDLNAAQSGAKATALYTESNPTNSGFSQNTTTCD